jgi:glycosyltransferase involved in cell wall biosynthesis
MQDASGFVLSSRHEPWGVVVQEAAASRLPLICSEACGAAVHFLQDGYNGFSFDTSNADHLAQCMVRLSELDPKKRKKMGERSYMLSKQFTPRRWADTLFEGVGHLCDGYQS